MLYAKAHPERVHSLFLCRSVLNVGGDWKRNGCDFMHYITSRLAGIARYELERITVEADYRVVKTYVQLRNLEPSKTYNCDLTLQSQGGRFEQASWRQKLED